MSGRCKQGRGRGGQKARDGRGHEKGNSYPSHINNLNNNNKGFCSALEHHVFDHGQKGATYKMRTTWEKIDNHVGTIYDHDISNEFQNKKRINILQPKQTHQVKDKHLKRVEQLRDQHSRLMQAI